MKPKLVFVGGFLGSGKTTLLLRVGEMLVNEHGRRVVMVTNDQGEVLVDSLTVKDYGFETAEVIRGCYCCNFQVFINHAQRILEELKPDVILAEPVGSCAGLMPTLYAPIKEFYSSDFELSPLIVVVDASRILQLHQEVNLLDSGDPIAFLIASQIREGEVICVNKIDLVDDSTTLEALNLLRKIRPEADFILTSAKLNVGVEKVVDIILGGASKGLPYPDIDMVKYTEAELQLSWFDGLYEIKPRRDFNPKAFIEDFLKEVGRQIEKLNGFIAHVKAYLRTSMGVFKASITSEHNVDLSELKNVKHPGSGIFLVNARVKLNPEELNKAINIALEIEEVKYNVNFSKIRSESFRPKPPKPQFYIPYSKD